MALGGSDARDDERPEGAAAAPSRDAESAPTAPIAPIRPVRTVRSEDAARAELYRLFEAHAPFLRSALARLVGPFGDADDLLQEVFLVALRRSDVLASAREPRAWLYGVAIKLATASRRKARVRRFLGLEAAPELEAHGTPDTSFEKVEAARQVYAALDHLSEKKRTVFILFELEGLTGEEIAHAVGCPLKTVWTRLFHARKEFAHHVARLHDRRPA